MLFVLRTAKLPPGTKSSTELFRHGRPLTLVLIRAMALTIECFTHEIWNGKCKNLTQPASTTKTKSTSIQEGCTKCKVKIPAIRHALAPPCQQIHELVCSWHPDSRVNAQADSLCRFVRCRLAVSDEVRDPGDVAELRCDCVLPNLMAEH